MSSVYNLFYEPTTGEIQYGTFGIQGPQGLGRQGFIGIPGTAMMGFQGLQGRTDGQAQGFQGFQGLQGHVGLLGVQGFQGLQGFQGHNVRGFQGYQGRQGFQGLRGVDGIRGIVGVIGLQGSTGVFPLQQDPIFIGTFAGFTGQSTFSTAIGQDAGKTNQGQYALAIGYQAGLASQAANSIILNALGTPLNSGTTGLFVNPIRFTTLPPISFGIQGNAGVQGYQGFQGFQGFQGLQGVQGPVGLQGVASGATGEIQYNFGNAFRASNNLVYSAPTNIFTFGAGTAGGRFDIVGSLSQGPTGSVSLAGDSAKIANVVDGRRNFEFFANEANKVYLVFHSNDSSTGVVWDSIVQSLGGVAGTNGKGLLEFGSINASRYNFNGTTSFFKTEGNFNYMAGNDRSIGNTSEIITTGTLAGGFSNIRVFLGFTGGQFNIMANAPSGGFAFRKFWAVKNSSTTFSFINTGTSAANNTAGVEWTVNNDGGGISIYLTNTILPSRTIYYTIVQTTRNPFYGI